MSNPLDWKAAGRFLALFVAVSTLARTTFTEMKVGLEIFDWILNEGKQFFIQNCLKPLAEEFLFNQVPRVEVVNQNTIRVNLDPNPRLPFEGAEVAANRGQGWAVVQKNTDGLYFAGRKVLLYVLEKQKGDKRISGLSLQAGLSDCSILPATVLDALLKHPDLIPEPWKEFTIFFWGTDYRGRQGQSYVRFLAWDKGEWEWFSGVHPLNYMWDSSSPAAMIAS